MKKSVSLLPEGEEKIILEIFNFRADYVVTFKKFFYLINDFEFTNHFSGL